MSNTNLEKLFHEPNRLAILCELITTPDSSDFTTLKKACDLTDGNLSRHLKKLEEAKIIKIKKKFIANKPCTLVSLSARGKKEFVAYIDQLERIVKTAAKRISEIEAEEKKEPPASAELAPTKG